MFVKLALATEPFLFLFRAPSVCGVDEGLGRKSRFGGGFGSLAELPRSFFFFFFRTERYVQAEGRAESLRTVEGIFILRGLGSEEKEQRDEPINRGKELEGVKVSGSSA